MAVTFLQAKCNHRLHRELLFTGKRPDLVVPPCRVGHLFRGVKRRKAPGRDQISGDLLSRRSTALSRH
eukprot:2162725-Pyramimonas_sp.AAC.1